MAVDGTQVLRNETYIGAVVVSGVSEGENYFKYQLVSNGGVASESIVSSGGYLTASNGGVASGAHVYVSGTLTVVSGGLARGITVEGIGTQGWTAADRGKLTVENGGAAEDCVVSSGGQLYVAKGASAVNTEMFQYGRIQINGIADGITKNNGALYIYGTVNDLANLGGNVIISSGGTLNGGFLKSGETSALSNAAVSGTFINQGGTLIVSSGAVADKVFRNGGQLSVRADGTAHIAYNPWQGGGTNFADGSIVTYYTFAERDGNIYYGDATNRLQQYWTTVCADFTVESGCSAIIYDGGTMTDTDLEFGGRIYVSNGGVADTANVSGNVIVYAGGTATDANIVSGGYVYVSSGGFMDGGYAFLGSAVISTGASARNVTVAGVGTQAWTGASRGALTLGGGGFAEGTVVSSGGQLYVAANASAIDTVVFRYGRGEVKGVADGVDNQSGTVYVSGVIDHLRNSGGGVSIYAGGLARNATAIGGDIHVLASGAVVSDTTVDGGNINVSNGGVASNIMVLKGKLIVTSNGSAECTTVSGGLLYVYSTGVVNHVEMFSAGSVTISGSASDVLMHRGVLSAWGTVDGLTQENGTVRVYSNGVLNNAVLYGGYVSAASGGTLGADHAAKLNSTTINSGAKIYVYSDARAEYTLVNRGGSAVIQNGGYISVRFNPWMGTVTKWDSTQPYTGVIEYLDRDAGVYYGNTTVGLINCWATPCEDLTVVSGNSAIVYSGGVANDMTVESGGRLYVSGGAVNGVSMSGATAIAYNDGEVNGLTILESGYFFASGHANVSGARLYTDTQDPDRLQYWIRGDGTASDTEINGYGYLVLDSNCNAKAVKTVLNSRGGLYVRNTGVATDTTVNDTGWVVLSSGGVMNTVAATSGAYFDIRGGARITELTAEAGAVFNIRELDAAQGAIFDSLADVDADAIFNVNADVELGDYNIADIADGDVTLNLVNTGWGLYDDSAVASGEGTANAFTSRSYDFTDGATLKIGQFAVGTAAEAATINADTATALLGGGFATKWDANTAYTGGVTVADAALGADAWLEIDGATVTAAPLYGATGNYAHTVNLYAKSGTIKSLAAGAEKNGSVAGVKLTVADADFTGAIYAGGFGSVTGATETLIAGGTFAMDVYAGALAVKNATATGIGDVNFTVTSGEFSGNIYGASAVRTAAAVGSGVRHTAGDVSLTLAGGEAAKKDFSVFAGGYATGDATGTVYMVEDIAVEVSGGSWGESRGGRGIFGGVFASQVAAEAGDVSITISDGEMGNVYGGGWAQQGGSSAAGDVSITISGGTIRNIVGGGSHSTSGGATSVGNVSITISGGDIANTIYARGQLTGDDVTGEALVTFSGATDFGCSVYGYSAVEGSTGADDRVALTFAGYTGTFSGAIGGFNSIEFNDGTVMTLATAAADVANTAWKFDVTGRDAALADVAMLDWAEADFEGDAIALNLASGSTTEWTLIDAARTAYDQFEVLVDGITQGTFALDEQIVDGEFAGWGFTLEDTTLKFKNLA